MANKTILMSKIRQILRLFTQGQSKIYISTYTDTSRNTVKRYIRRFLQERLTFEDITAMSDTDLEVLFTGRQMPGPDHRFDELQRMLPDMEKRFRQKGMTISQLWKEYRDLGTPAFG